MHKRGLRYDAAIVLTLLILPILFFWPVTLGGKTLLPADNAFAWEPWKSYADEVGVGVPHNDLLSDLYLENYVWKRFIVSSLRQRQLPLWNPYILSGVPFLAAGQHSAMYPLSALFYVLPLPMAYGWFAALHLFLAGLFIYLFARTLRVSRMGGLVSALSFAFGGFMVIRNVFPMVIAAAVWLPLVLLSIERIVARAEDLPFQSGLRDLIAFIPVAALGTGAIGMVFLAGHPEMYYYVALISGAYAAWRLVGTGTTTRSWRPPMVAAGVIGGIALVGLGLGCAQWVPLLKLVRQNFREGSASFREVLGWAYPMRRVISLFVPDFFGNPSHHNYLDLFSGKTVPVSINALGQQIDNIYWGMKNYVEGASYVGILPTLLALVAILRRRGRRLGFLVLLAILSLLFVFGSPLYIIIFKLPGLSQVHSPFRWVYAYSLCVAIMAGMGLDALWQERENRRSGRGWRATLHRLTERALPLAAFMSGLGGLACLGISLLAKERVASLAERAMHHLARAPEAVADGRMFYSYEFRNLLIFATAVLASGLVLLARSRMRRIGIWGTLVALVIVSELFVIGRPFFPAVDRELVGHRTPAIDYLAEDGDLFRITSYIGGSEKTLNANAGMFYDLYDIRGYDSIIPKHYAETMGVIQKQSELQYNRIAPLCDWSRGSLDAPLIDAMNVKYVLTDRSRQIDTRGYSLVYEDEIRIYRNEEVLPRAFMVPAAEVILDQQARHEALRTFDPRQVVILEETPDQPLLVADGADRSQAVRSIEHTPNEVTITLDAAAPGYLVLSDTYFDGWLAFIRPLTDKGEAPAEPPSDERSLRIYKANGSFRAVAVPAGRHVVRFKYSPNEVKFGLYLSFLSGIIWLLALALWVWSRLYRRPGENETVQRVTKNTVTPIALNLVNKIIDMAFAMLMLRILGPVDAGKFYFAVVVISWFDIFINFGLSTLLTREVSKDRAHANRYLSNTTILRIALWVVSGPILALFFSARSVTKPIDSRTILAITLFGVGLLPSNISASFAAVFTAYERMEVPASVTTLTTLLKVLLGTVALLSGAGYVGLGAASVVVNVITMVVLYLLLRATLFRPRVEIDLAFQRRMLRASYPLMINLLLATLFFKVAVLVLEWLEDPRVVGWYSTAFKYVDAVQLVPSYFTMAIFPLLSRYATRAGDSLLKAYVLATKLLVIVAVPLSLVGWALSEELITILGGSQYLPFAARVLAVMIWHMPLGFVNSVTQYVLIALNRQRYLTRAFAIGLAFNLIANIALIGRFGYMAAAYVAIASELALVIPFMVGVRRYLAPISLPRVIWKQALSAMPMLLMCALLPRRFLGLGLVAGLGVYALGLALLRVFDRDEQDLVGQVLSLDRVRGGLRRLVGRASSP